MSPAHPRSVRNELVAAVIVSYNTHASLRRCIGALRNSESGLGESLQIVVVDNASTDGSAEEAAAADVCIRNDDNVGFGAAVNQGFAAVDADYYLVLNPDVTCEPTTVSRLLMCMRRSPEVGAVGASPRDESGRPQTRGYYRREPTLMQVLLFETSLRALARRLEALVCRWLEYCDLRADGDVPQVPGGFFMTSADVIRQVGGFDEDFFVWYEDVDWSIRVRRSGLRLVYCADASVRHVGGESFHHWPHLRQRLVHASSLRTYFRKHRPAVAPLVTALLLLDALARSVLRPGRGDLAFLKAMLTSRTRR